MNIDGSELRYWEGEVVSRDNRGTLVQWHDDSRERIFTPTDAPLSHLENGTMFGAWVELAGPDVCMIDQVTRILP